MLLARLKYVLMTMFVVLPTYAQDAKEPGSVSAGSDQRRTLKGLQSVRVRVLNEGSGPIDGSTLEVLRTTAELHLRQNGIKIPDEASAIQGQPLLTISFTFYDIGKSSQNQIGGYAFFLLCQLSEDVRLDRDQSPARAVTWAKGMVGTTNSDVIHDHSKRIVLELVDFFVNDFLTENPR